MRLEFSHLTARKDEGVNSVYHWGTTVRTGSQRKIYHEVFACRVARDVVTNSSEQF